MQKAIRTLAGVFEKEISEKEAKELSEEIKAFLKAGDFIENMPNLELESFMVKVTKSGQIVDISGMKTKIEHDKVLGIFTTSNADNSNYGSMLSVQIDRKFVIANGMFDFKLIEKAPELSIYESAFRTDVPVNTSDVSLSYKDSGLAAIPYTCNVYFICRKR